ncbi:MAG: aryl-sulfate sulfotransferase [Actinobacteria bacterium]|nr:aryl-sulfate sulfotransferase [Actinomycetota bacterium]
MSGVRGALAAGVAALAACIIGGCGGTGSSPVTSIRADPALFPAFKPGITDYVVRCAAGATTGFRVRAKGGARVSVAGRAHAGTFQVKPRLKPGQALTFAVQSGGSRTYHVRCLPADFPRWSVSRASTSPQAQWYVLTPYSLQDSTAQPNYVAIFDNHGVPVWWSRRTRPVVDATVLSSGELAWARRSGQTLGVDPSGAVEIHRLDGSSTVRTLRTVGSPTDFHEIQELPNGHFLVLTYVPRDHVDLSRYGGPKSATVLDGAVEELTPSGRLVWSWSTRGHVALSETGRWFHQQVLTQPVRLADGRAAYDIVHVNSVAPDGRYVLVSARHLDAVYAVDRATGRIAWKLGGTRTPRSLTLSGARGKPTDLGGLHDVRVRPDGTITVHDNRTGLHGAPRALRIAIDLKRRTASVVEQVVDPYSSSSPCCGSARRLPTGDWVIAWGGTADVVETAPRGGAIFRIRFSGATFSYRALPVMPGVLSAERLRRGMDAMAPR